MMERRIALAGASGTGKTTLTKSLAAAFGLPINPIGSRSVAAAMGFASPYDVDAAGKRAEFQRRLLDEKRAWEAERPTFATDRTTLDNLAYTTLHDVASIDDATIAIAIEAVARYTDLVFCPIDSFCSPGDDAARVKSLAYHRVYEATLRGLLEYAYAVLGTRFPRFHAVEAKTLEARKAFALAATR